MPFLEHLEELRLRLFRVIGAVLLMAIISYFWVNELFSLLFQPLRSSGLSASWQVDIIGTSPAEAFTTKLKITAVAGVILSLPFSFYQLWHFVAPGLHEEEKKLVIPFVFFSTLFFLVGVSFCYYAAFPVAFTFFVQEYQSIAVSPRIQMSEYLEFIVTSMLVFGIMFELPVLSYFLARMKLLSSQLLIKNSRYAIVAIFIIAAVLTPPDVVSQLLLAVPLTVLYGLCILVCRAVERSRDSSHGTQT